MEMVAPQGPVYQAGTLSGNLYQSAGLATLTELAKPGVYEYCHLGLINWQKVFTSAEKAGVAGSINKLEA